VWVWGRAEKADGLYSARLLRTALMNPMGREGNCLSFLVYLFCDNNGRTAARLDHLPFLR
jgi:hypothetical protein